MVVKNRTKECRGCHNHDKRLRAGWGRLAREATVNETVIGVLHPGEMGAAVAHCLTGHGQRVVWAADGRSAATAERAQAAGLADVGTLAGLARQAGVIFSICPPHAALAVAEAAAGFGGLFVDANAISPATARRVAAVITDGGGSYVDGGIVGPPPLAPGFTRLYLSGPGAGQVSGLFDGTALEARVLPGEYTASALKMAYASWTKGTAALVLAARALARAQGAEDALVAEWARSQPGLADRTGRSARSAAGKGWRWIAEMEEIAAAMDGAGLPAGFHLAAAEVYRRTATVSPETVSPATASPTMANPGQDGSSPGTGGPGTDGPGPDGEPLLDAVLSALLRSGTERP
jgi:3-hydroxyisobutyrate dehydrogenase-like beta-hydroxyacid dehydrogenase